MCIRDRGCEGGSPGRCAHRVGMPFEQTLADALQSLLAGRGIEGVPHLGHDQEPVVRPRHGDHESRTAVTPALVEQVGMPEPVP